MIQTFSPFKKDKNLFHLIVPFVGVLMITILSCGPREQVNKSGNIKEISQVVELSVAEQLKEIMTFWPGNYNNDAQIEEVIKAGKDVWRIDDSGENGYLQIQSHYILLDKPEIGPHVLYVEEYRDHKPTETYRQRIYTLSIDSSNMIKVKMWPFKDKKKYVGAWNDLSMLDDLTLDNISAFPDICDLHVTRVDNEYHMVMNGKDCSFGDKTFNYQVKLSKNMFSYRDKITQKSDDKMISTAANFTYHDLDKIQ